MTALIFCINLPLQNPVLKFSIILFIILFAPILLNKVKIPHLIGLIIAGALIGPNGFQLMLRDSSIILFGTVGLLYIMFLAGLEINLTDFKQNSFKSVTFGLYTFAIPMAIGTLVAYYLLQFRLETSVLLASMFASHTLVSYPIVGKFGVIKNRAVNITIGGTMITDTLALLVLAVITGITTGDVTTEWWIRLGLGILLFAAIVIFLFPIVARWFFKQYDDNISQYIFVLAMVFLAGFLAEEAGIESIIGAFLAGLALNRLIPHTSPLMNRIEFVGNALFIPFFLISVGMLIDLSVFRDLNSIIVAVTMTLIAIVAKWLAAYFTQKTFSYTQDERNMIFGLSSAQAAATLAVVLVGYNIVLDRNPEGDPIRLLDESILNGSILMILVTCTIASFSTQSAAKNLAIKERMQDQDQPKDQDHMNNILIPLSNPDTVEDLIDLGAMIRPRKAGGSLNALNVINKDDVGSSEKYAQEIMEKAQKAAAATDSPLNPIIRHDINLINGITNVMKEQKVTDIILGLHKKIRFSDSFLGYLTEGLLKRSNVTTFIYRPVQPINTVKRQIVIAPPDAEKEPGFAFWLLSIWKIAENTKATMVFYASPESVIHIREVYKKHRIEAEFNEFVDWEDFLIISRVVRKDDGLIVILSRKEALSYAPVMQKIPRYLTNYFHENNIILIYPIQHQATANNIDYIHNYGSDPIIHFDDMKNMISKLFKSK